ncbi:hypothetical protein CANARDRAFT_30203 [[Candida] arabinofermentans NRRL YB-2248]|uniref:Uncharacterized protein n=1 Tax=[Candida] arabinofermentans NRRL YB-2248 TaxID=983967 RepID=A0A1E4SUT2_9ASCO|nr:hypothetical protein CANARDRAFT_30203 [[Candida] arabinofermentans NRRL YB-2248]
MKKNEERPRAKVMRSSNKKNHLQPSLPCKPTFKKPIASKLLTIPANESVSQKSDKRNEI